MYILLHAGGCSILLDSKTNLAKTCSILVSTLTCHALDDDDELYPVSFVESPPAFLVVVSVTEVPARCVQQSEVVPTRWKIENIIFFSITYTGAKNPISDFFYRKKKIIKS